MANEAVLSEEPRFATTPETSSSDTGVRTTRSLHVMLPTLSHERRQKILEVHHQAAAVLSRAMREHLGEGDRLFFEGLSFATFREVCALEEAGALTAAFALEAPKAAGLMIANPGLTAYLARAFLGRKTAPADVSSQSLLTRLERSIAANALKTLTNHLSVFYAGVGLYGLQCSSTGEPMAGLLRFNPDDYLALLRLRLGAMEPAMQLTIAAGMAFLTAFHPDDTTEARVSAAVPEVVRATAGAPLDAAIVLGSWNVSLGELMELRIGDEIVLPEGDNAWLVCSGIRLLNVRLEFTPKRLRATARGTLREVPGDIQRTSG